MTGRVSSNVMGTHATAGSVSTDAERQCMIPQSWVWRRQIARCLRDLQCKALGAAENFTKVVIAHPMSGRQSTCANGISPRTLLSPKPCSASRALCSGVFSTGPAAKLNKLAMSLSCNGGFGLLDDSRGEGLSHPCAFNRRRTQDSADNLMQSRVCGTSQPSKESTNPRHSKGASASLCRVSLVPMSAWTLSAADS